MYKGKKLLLVFSGNACPHFCRMQPSVYAALCQAQWYLAIGMLEHIDVWHVCSKWDMQAACRDNTCLSLACTLLLSCLYMFGARL